MNIRKKRRLKFMTPGAKTLKIEGNFEPEAKEQPKPLFLVMQRKWFDLINSGEKIEEYRDGTEFYFSRFCNRDKAGKVLSLKKYKTAILQEGYHQGARRLIVEIDKISYYGDFTVHIGNILKRINF